ncbi:hypothetical protein P4S64_12475 [Vibrio sp. M60_M31a]
MVQWLRIALSTTLVVTQAQFQPFLATGVGAAILAMVGINLDG